MTQEELEQTVRDLYTLTELLTERIELLEDKIEQMLPTVS